MLSGIGLFKGIMTKMDWLDQNQRVIAQNVANADTPGYAAQELKPLDFEEILGASLRATSRRSATQNISMQATDGMHMGEAGSSGMASEGIKAKTVRHKITYEASPDNNGVVLEEQMLAANKNAAARSMDISRRAMHAPSVIYRIARNT